MKDRRKERGRGRNDYEGTFCVILLSVFSVICVCECVCGHVCMCVSVRAKKSVAIIIEN